MTRVTIGADPELFIYSGSIAVSAHALLPGTKWNPVKVPRGAIQVDGVAAEFNIDPAKNRTEFLRNIKHVRSLLEKFLKKENPHLELRAEPVAWFNPVYFDNLPAEVKALGCEPDFNAYTEKANEKPETTLPFRTGSGHVHIGWDTAAEEREADHAGYIQRVLGMTKALDFTLYKASLQWDIDTERRKLYGQPGAFRFKPYGLEYRVLSNKWLDKVRTQMYVHDAAKSTAERYLKGLPIQEDADDKWDFNQYCSFLTSRGMPSLLDYSD